ncbi:MAG: ABC transporter permease [Candidatus Tectomicrobia bacterium]|uniref:Cell division protein FtsX n=1 Tax=Tectimicrobiota bacterium TaxID=2528274 RepID=A0A932M0L8_UNCTE|nr:ABC transporter permease [Candidatus Tectomicrobia bacterium]
MNWSSMTFVIRETVGNFLRRKGEAFFVTSAVTVSMVILGAFGLLLTNLERALENLGEQVRVVVFLRDDLTPTQRSRLEDTLRRQSEVERFRFVSKEEAYAQFTQSFPGNRNLLAGIEGNPLPASYLVSLKGEFRQGRDLERLSRTLSSVAGIEDVEYGKKWLERFEAVVATVRVAGIVIGSLLGFSVLFIIASSIQRSMAQRQEELEVLQWAGATRTMMRMPILCEGAFLGGCCAVLALALLGALFWALQSRLNLSAPFLGLPPPVFFSRQVIGGGVAAGVALGVVGSSFACRPLSRKHGA